jgi:hypothetical protein
LFSFSFMLKSLSSTTGFMPESMFFIVKTSRSQNTPSVRHIEDSTTKLHTNIGLLCKQGILKGEVSLYRRWLPVWLVWNQLFDNWQFLFLFAKQTNPNQSNKRSMVQWCFPFSIPWCKHQIVKNVLYNWYFHYWLN